MPSSPEMPLRIVHVVRAPVGGIFRHILDLTEGQIARGHKLGFIVDSLTGGERAQAALAEILPRLALGLARFPIPREFGPADAIGLYRTARHLAALAPDVVHGHGAKGGAFVRLAPIARRAIRVYTPHGGSLHYGPRTLRGIVYGNMEWALMGRTELFLFESAFARNTYERTIGTPKGLVRVVPNGVSAAEFEPIVPAATAADLAYVGEFRDIKGADVLIDAVALLRGAGRNVRVTMAGDGVEDDALRAQVERLRLGANVRFAGHVPARAGFANGRVLVVPSRGDSLPYVVIEAAAAGIPIVATNVGGIPEIFGPLADTLVPPGDPRALSRAIAAALDDPQAAKARAQLLRERVRVHFSQTAMVDGVLAAYREARDKR